MKKLCFALAALILTIFCVAIAENGYTVDFHYEDETYSIEGGTSIHLSALIDVLGIDENIVDASISDESLVEILHTRGGILLESKKPFDTEKELVLTTGDGEQIVVRVTDAASYPNFTINVYPSDAGSVKANGVSGESITASLKTNGTNNNSITATASSGYVFDHWEVDGVTKSGYTSKLDGGAMSIGTSGEHTLTAVFKKIDPFTFTVRSADPTQGTVSGIDSTGNNKSYEPSFTATAKMESVSTGYNDTTIIANGNNGYKFAYWQLKDGNTVLKTYTSRQLGAGSLEITKNGLTLEAHFEKAQEGQSPDPLNVDDLIQQWKEKMTEEFTVDKTAHVIDYANRIYEVDLSTSSGFRMIYPAVSINFITDTSRSMYFPATIEQVGSYDKNTSSIKTWFNNLTTEEQRAKTYFFIGDKDGTSTMFAAYFKDGEWYYTDASYYRAPDGATSTEYKINNINNNQAEGTTKREIDPVIYTSTERESAWAISYRNEEGTRLYYLKQALYAAAEVIYALSPNARIGLTTFNATAKFEGAFTDISSFNKALSTIALSGGTRQDYGLSTATGFFNTGDAENNGHQYAAVLITDGAPQPTGSTYTEQDVTNIWTAINTNASTLKSYQSGGKNLVLYTLGLSLSNVGENQGKLNDVATTGKAYNADTGSATIAAIEQIVQDLTNDMSLYGSVTDTLDPVFYPVDNNGNPIETGLYDANGNKLNAAPTDGTPYYAWTFADGIWAITWYNQTFDWENEETHTPGWSKSFHVKTKEDYFGGNTIKTNSDTADIVTATGYISSDGSVTSFDVPITSSFDTPYVNIDNLALTENETEWTVYVDTTITPLEQVKKLFNEIDVREVVSESTDHMITTKDQMLGGTSEDSEIFKLSDVVELTDEQWEKLAKGESVTVPYSAYGHESGVIEVKLTGDNNTKHDLKGDETYTLTVEYKPYDPQSIDYHTTPNKEAGAPTDEMTSTNKHLLHIIQTGLQINKVDESGDALEGVSFAVYKEDEEGTTITDLPEGKKYISAGAVEISGNVITLNPVYPIQGKDGIYPAGETTLYLVETSVPDGYKKLSEPIEVTFTVAEMKVPENSGESEESEEQNPLLVKWVQDAAISLASEQDDVKMLSDTDHVLVLRITNSPQSVTINVSGEKKVLPESVGLAEGQFSFILQPATRDGEPLVGEAALAYAGFSEASITVTNDSEGRFDFGDLVFTVEDYDATRDNVFYYLVTEDTSNALQAYRYDESKYLVTVTLSIDENGELTADKIVEKLTESD